MLLQGEPHIVLHWYLQQQLLGLTLDEFRLRFCRDLGVAHQLRLGLVVANATPGFHFFVEHESNCWGVERPQVLEILFRFQRLRVAHLGKQANLGSLVVYHGLSLLAIVCFVHGIHVENRLFQRVADSKICGFVQTKLAALNHPKSTGWPSFSWWLTCRCWGTVGGLPRFSQLVNNPFENCRCIP